jgi:PAS domain S-box-containing protein
MNINNPMIIYGGAIGGLAVLAAISFFLTRRIRRGGSHGKGNANTSKLVSSLRDEKLKSSIILNAIEDGVILVDDQQTIRLFNPGASKITGWNSNDAVGLSWQAVFKIVNTKGEPINSIQDPVTRLFSTKETIRDSAANLLTKSGKIIALSLVVSPILDEGQHITGAVGVLRDVSEERQEEQQRAEFISTASHEMRTPVAAIEGYLALALNDKVSTIDTRARSFLEKAHASTQHLGKLFQDLLTSAKAEDGRLTNHPDVVEIGSFLEQLAGDLRFAAEKKGLGVEFVFGTSRTIDASKNGQADKLVKPLYYAYADPDRIREVITNLFDNAVKYTDTGKISIGLTGNDQVVQFFIRDTGFGIPPEDIPHMFQKFYRVDNSATRTIGGTGLGLFICRKIVELYGGRIWVESELDKGSTFYINLPRLNAAKADELKAKNSNGQVLQPINSLASTY